ncbi:hypothetical protein SAMN04515647_3696 [Cohaesibacter sp. ES.047]|uniref:helix-turn-helix domain-containing protein n=1 Tax=Cohaesibacter sp. ES.047 TaxID=1798205 RepID=UPI000BB7F977|nr:helix-turn-helix transcriptional regulator [Cohaesibacter sp. ES.047]SNY93401.1 hypothetical protein SAMN04515647_3696 [Cohaesibacter sp. ES.047]
MKLDRSRAATRQRHAAWFKAHVEDGQSTHAIAAACDLKHHTTVYNGILAHAKRIGLKVSRLEDLTKPREGGPSVDWSDFSGHVRYWRECLDLTEEEAASRAAISRTALRNAEQGRTLESVTMLALCKAIPLNPISFFLNPTKESSHDRNHSKATPPAFKTRPTRAA